MHRDLEPNCYGYHWRRTVKDQTMCRKQLRVDEWMGGWMSEWVDGAWAGGWLSVFMQLTGFSHSWDHRIVASSWRGFPAPWCSWSSEAEIKVHLPQNTPRLKSNIMIRIVSIFCHCDILFAIRWIFTFLFILQHVTWDETARTHMSYTLSLHPLDKPLESHTVKQWFRKCWPHT